MKKIILFEIMIFTVILNVYANDRKDVKLIKCVDGDTAIFDINGEKTRVRFLGIDTPESVKEENVVDLYGKEASDYTCNKLTNAEEIILEYDDNSDKVDKYGRTLAWIFVDNSLLELDLISLGYAKVRYIYGNYTYTNELYKAQNVAKENKLGIWNDYVPVYYKITFKIGDKVEEKLIEEGKKIEYFEPKREGYTFIGWFNGDEKFDFNTYINDDIILTARYEKDINIIRILLISILILTIYFIINMKGK